MPGRLGTHLMHGMDGLYTVVAGSFTTVDGAAPTIRAGTGFTVARTAEGRFTVTIANSAEIVSVVVSLARETLPDASETLDLVDCFLDQDATTATAFEVRLYITTNLGAADPDPTLDDDPGSEIHFIAVVGKAA